MKQFVWRNINNMSEDFIASICGTILFGIIFLIAKWANKGGE